MVLLMLIEIVKMEHQGGELDGRATVAQSCFGISFKILHGCRYFKYCSILQLGDV
jgi:hypothetical protein